MAGRLPSLVETCKLNGVDPQVYFTDVLTKLVNLWPAWLAERFGRRSTLALYYFGMMVTIALASKRGSRAADLRNEFV